MKKDSKKNNIFNRKNKWEETILLTHVTIDDVLRNLNKSGLRISLIVNDKKEF